MAKMKYSQFIQFIEPHNAVHWAFSTENSLASSPVINVGAPVRDRPLGENVMDFKWICC